MIRILKREYSNPYAPAEEIKPDWLIGNVGDWIRLKMEVEAGVDFLASQSDPIFIDKEERSIKMMNGSKWNDFGFDTGAIVEFVYKVDTVEDDVITTENVNIELEIEQLFGDILIYKTNVEMNDVPYDTLPTDRGNKKVYSVKFFDTREMQGVRLKYTNIENAEVENHSLKSFIDGTETEFFNSKIQDLTEGSGWSEMTPVGNQSGMSIEGARIRKSANNDLPIYETMFDYEQKIYKYGTAIGRSVRNAWALPVDVVFGKPNYKKVTPAGDEIPLNNAGTYQNGKVGNLFYYNANSDNVKRFDLNFSFKVLSTNKTNPSCAIKLILIRYINGTALNLGDITVLKTWSNGEFPNGIVLNYNDYFIKNINAGDSFCLGLEWYNPNGGNPTLRWINAQVVDISGYIYEFEEGFTSYKKKYEIEVDFMLSSFFEEITDLENNQPPEVVFDANSLSDNFSLMFLPEWNNPNISITNDMKETERLGNTGWFNENYNGLENNFKVEEVVYKDLGGATIESLSYGSDTKIKVRISGVNNLSVESDFKYGFMWLPLNEESYKNLKTPFHKNTKINSEFNTVAFNPNTQYPYIYEGFSNDNAKMNVRNVSFTISGDDLYFEAIFSPTSDFREFFTDKVNDRKYTIWVSVADRTLVTNFSDRVSLLVDVKNMGYFIPISGELPGVTNKFIEHPEGYLVEGVDIYNGFMEDDILARTFFTLDSGKRLDQVILGYEVENILTGLTYELDRFVINTAQFNTLSNGSQQIEFNSERGYKMESGNNKNWVKLIRDTASDGNNKFGYQILFASKIRWEDWILRQNVPVEFFDSSLKLNGYSNKWLDYLNNGEGSHKINFFVLFDMVEQTGISRYKNKFEIRFDDYDQNEGIITTHEYFNNETNEVLNIGTDADTGKPLAVLLGNKNTRIEISYEKTSGTWNLGEVYGIIGIEVSEGVGVMEYRQLSSIWGSESDNLLIPLPNEEKLKIEVMQPNIIKTTCLVDYSKLNDALKYKISGRIGCFKNDNGLPEYSRIHEQNYELKYE